MTLTYRGAGTVTEANNANITPPLFESPTAGDFLFCAVMWRVATTETVTLPAGWTQRYHANAAARMLDLWYKEATGGDADPLVTVSAGGASGNVIVGRCFSIRPSSGSTMSWGTDGATYSATSGQNIGPITVATGAVEASGAVFFFGHRTSGDATGVATLSGDGLTWSEIVDYHTLTGSDSSFVGDVGIWSGGVPTLTDKTFTFTDGTNNTRLGKSALFNEVLSAGGQPAIKRMGGVQFAASPWQLRAGKAIW